MEWRSFIDFWIMREMGQQDTIFRNYDLLRYSGDGKANLHCALRRIGFKSEHIDHADSFVTDVAQRISNVYNVPRPETAKVRLRLIAWYNWHRIRTGEIRKWYKSDVLKRSV